MDVLSAKLCDMWPYFTQGRGYIVSPLSIKSLQLHKKVMVSFLILVFLFNHGYLWQFCTKNKNQGQFWNMLVIRILKIPLLLEFEKDVTETLKVKDKAQNPKWHHYFFVQLLSLPGQS